MLSVLLAEEPEFQEWLLDADDSVIDRQKNNHENYKLVSMDCIDFVFSKWHRNMNKGKLDT